MFGPIIFNSKGSLPEVGAGGCAAAAATHRTMKEANLGRKHMADIVLQPDRTEKHLDS
jgi:hypothetical protein